MHKMLAELELGNVSENLFSVFNTEETPKQENNNWLIKKV